MSDIVNKNKNGIVTVSDKLLKAKLRNPFFTYNIINGIGNILTFLKIVTIITSFILLMEILDNNGK